MTTIATCQMGVADLDSQANFDRVSERLEGLPDRVEVALFPEMALTGFVADERISRGALDRETALGRIRELATAHDTTILVGYVESAGDRCYNATAYVPPSGEATVYRKRHLWGGEQAVLTPGEDLVTVETLLGTAGLVTCYDLNFVHDSAAFTDRRVDALFVVGAWPAAYGASWRLLVRARALDGARWAIACGRTGRRDVPDARTVEYAGRSLVAHPDGSLRAALATHERDLVTDLDPETLAQHREAVGIFDGIK